MHPIDQANIDQIKTMRTYLDSLPPSANEKKAYCFTLTIAQINKLLSQKNNGEILDGLRIYLGAEMVDGHMVPNIHVVACEKDELDNYNDFEPEGGTGLLDKEDKAKKPLVAKGRPCPTDCGKRNIVYP